MISLEVDSITLTKFNEPDLFGVLGQTQSLEFAESLGKEKAAIAKTLAPELTGALKRSIGYPVRS